MENTQRVSLKPKADVPYAGEKGRIDAALDAALERNLSERASSLLDLLPQLQRLSAAQPPRIAIKSQRRIVFINPREILAIQSQGNYVLLQRQSGTYLLRASISSIAEKLKPYGFVRVHRSVLLNSSLVEQIRPCTTGEYEIQVRGGKTYTASRTYKKHLSELAESWIGTGSF